MPRDMLNGRISRDSVGRISEATAERLRVHRLAAGDLVLARRGDVGRLSFVAPDEAGWVCGTGSMRIHAPNHDVLNPLFLRYAMSSPGVIEWLTGQAVGATMPNLNAKIVSAVPIRVPGTVTQRRIATVLAAFDELIEINERRIELLEDLAQSLYREWFVHFRFPGHEGIKMVESDLGRIPAGWEVRAAGDVFDVLGGGTPSKKRVDYWEDGQIPWFTPSDLTRARRRFAVRSSARITDLGLERSAARLFPPGSVLMTSRATLGVLAIAAVSCTCNQGFIASLQSQGIHPSLYMSGCEAERRELRADSHGCDIQRDHKGCLQAIPDCAPGSSCAK